MVAIWKTENPLGVYMSLSIFLSEKKSHLLYLFSECPGSSSPASGDDSLCSMNAASPPVAEERPTVLYKKEMAIDSHNNPYDVVIL